MLIAFLLAGCVVANPSPTDIQGAVGPVPVSLQDVAYGPLTTCPQIGCRGTQTFDLMPATTGSGPRPVIVWLHGGGWTAGDKSDGVFPQILAQASRGYTIVNANYRLAGGAPPSPEGDGAFPNPILDVKRLIRWIKVHSTELDVDPSRITVAGHSAGGNLALMVAATTGGQFEPVADPLDPFDVGIASVDSTVAAAVSIAGLTDLATFLSNVPTMAVPDLTAYLGTTTDPERLMAAEPGTYTSSRTAPMYLAIGGTDPIEPPTSAWRFVGQHLGAGGALESIWIDIVEGEGHIPASINQTELNRFLDDPSHRNG